MELPNGGKVVIVDDCRNEIEPLIDILSKRNTPILYFSGLEESLPDTPLTGVRLVFLDLRFSPNIDEKTVVGNARVVLKKLISDENGPFLLVTWSSTGDDHKEALREALEETNIFPEDIVSLAKSDYFETKRGVIESNMSTIRSILDEDPELDTVAENRLAKKFEMIFYSEIDESKKIFQNDKYDDLVAAIDDAIKKAGILPLFVVWENAVLSAASNTVNSVYSAVPDETKPEKRLMAVANSLSKNVLEQRYEKASKEERLQAAFTELSDLFSFFFESENCEIEGKISVELKGGNETDLKGYTSIMNTWKLVRFVGKYETPGRAFIDTECRFKWSSLAKTIDTIDQVQGKIKQAGDVEEKTIYIYMNINGECETAQKKAKGMKIVPGIVVEKSFSDVCFPKINELEDRDNLKVFGPFYYKGADKYIIFSLDQCSYIEFPEKLDESLFLLNRRYYFLVRQKIANNFSKQGEDLYKI